FGLEKKPAADIRKIECGGNDGIEIKQRERRNQEISPVDSAEMDHARAGPSQQITPGQYRSEEKRECQYGQVFLHGG
ncbi:MAG TPA: hypothetical protein VFM11_13575, partial [Burkholderiales bacterium]|nr:hypothetical protein [Burkholderiales bacterium]